MVMIQEFLKRSSSETDHLMFPYSALLHVEIARFTLRLPHYRLVAQGKPFEVRSIYTERAQAKNKERVEVSSL